MAHLEEDLVMETYVFLSNHISYKVDKLVLHLCELIRAQELEK